MYGQRVALYSQPWQVTRLRVTSATGNTGYPRQWRERECQQVMLQGEHRRRRSATPPESALLQEAFQLPHYISSFCDKNPRVSGCMLRTWVLRLYLLLIFLPQTGHSTGMYTSGLRMKVGFPWLAS